MKLIFLNAWDAKIERELEEFLKKHSADTDIFCFQEAGGKMGRLCERILFSHAVASGEKDADEWDRFSQFTYVRRPLEIKYIRMLLEGTPSTGLGVYTQIKDGDKTLHVCNFHGVSKPGDKLDTPERLRQSKEIINFFGGLEGPKIIGGDFNLDPNSRSVEMFEKAGYKNLIEEFSVQTTRNRLVWERYPGEKQYFSDYVFVSPDVQVKNFTVEDIEISDHLPMLLNIEA